MGFEAEVRELDARRRVRTTVVLARVLAGAGVVLTLGSFALLEEAAQVRLTVVAGVMSLGFIGASEVARRGKGTFAALVLVALPCIGAWITVVASERQGAGPFYVGVSLVVALVTLEARVLRWVLLGVVLCELLMVAVAARLNLHPAPAGIVLFTAALLAVMSALIVWLHAQLFARLLEQVAEQRTRVVEAETQVDQLRKMEALGRFAGGIAHDFNNLLTVMRACANTVEKSASPVARREVADLQESISRASALTAQLLAFARRETATPVRLETNVLLSRLAELARRLVGERVSVELAIAPDVWPLWAGPSQVDQLLLNLVANARDAMPDGGTLTISAANAAGSPVGDAVVLRVSDTGVGMPPETLAHAFEPFFTTKQSGFGTGLGLATVFGVVKALGGEISAASTPGRGTTISIWLPRPA